MTYTLYQQVLDTIEPRETFTQRLLEWAALNNIGQQELAVEAEIDPANLSKFKLGRRAPSLETMLRLEAAATRLIDGDEG